jgi:RimJ/RimL family protein N-acetyltransferase
MRWSRTGSNTGLWRGETGRRFAPVSPNWTLRTARLVLRPVSAVDLPHLIRLKADPIVFGQMLGGVRSPWQVSDELAKDVVQWGIRGAGMFAVLEGRKFQGVAGIQERPDGRGLALRFAVWPEARGRGIGREAAGAALRFAHDRAGLRRVIAVARADNFGSRMVLGSIGMTECDAFMRDGQIMVVYESVLGSPAEW